MTTIAPSRPNKPFSRRLLLYLPLLLAAVFYLIRLYLMLSTGFKSFAEVDLQRM